MKKIFKHIIAAVSLLTLGSEMIAKIPERDPYGELQEIENELEQERQHRRAIIQAFRQHIDFEQEQDRQANIEARGDEALRHQVPAQQMQRDAIFQSFDPEEDLLELVILGTVVTNLAYFGMYNYLLPASVSAYMPHSDYAFVGGCVNTAVCLAYKAYKTKCENGWHKISKGITYASAALGVLCAFKILFYSPKN